MASDNIPTATEVSSHKVEVPPDPERFHVRRCVNGEWWTYISADTLEEAQEYERAARRDHGVLATRIVRIPPQGEQADAVKVSQAEFVVNGMSDDEVMKRLRDNGITADIGPEMLAQAIAIHKQKQPDAVKVPRSDASLLHLILYRGLDAVPPVEVDRLRRVVGVAMAKG